MSIGFIDSCKKLTACIACGDDNLVPVLNLGLQPLANSYKTHPDDLDHTYPLAINRCGKCFHVQLTHSVNPDLLFKHYLYVSGTSETQLRYFEGFAEQALKQWMEPDLRVLDVGCNDGSQLDAFKSRGAKTYGVDPAVNLHEKSSAKHNVLCQYFTPGIFEDVAPFDLIICQNAFAHNYDQLAFLTTAATLMHDDSQLIITTSQADMLINREFDTIYHEHLSFYNTRSMQELCARAGLYLTDLRFHPIHGNSAIYTIEKRARPSQAINIRLRQEENQGIYSFDLYESYARGAWQIILSFKETIERYRNDGAKLIGYGAAAKGNTLLNAAGVKLDCIIDDNPLKQGLFTPGVGTPIVEPTALNAYADKNILFVPLAWNFFEEITQRIKTLRGGRKDSYLRYFPKVEIKVK